MATFHLFPQLPAELRIRIWELTVEPREVKVCLTKDDRRRWFSPTPIPGALHACTASRSTLQSLNYTRAFTTWGLYVFRHSFFKDNYPFIWINFYIDTIRISDGLMSSIESEDAPLIELLVIDSDHIEVLLVRGLQRFVGLERLTILSSDTFDCEGSRGLTFVKDFEEEGKRRIRIDEPPRQPVDAKVIDAKGQEINLVNWRSWRSGWPRWRNEHFPRAERPGG